jgi:hypothetical protein
VANKAVAEALEAPASPLKVAKQAVTEALEVPPNLPAEGDSHHHLPHFAEIANLLI